MARASIELLAAISLSIAVFFFVFWLTELTHFLPNLQRWRGRHCAYALEAQGSFAYRHPTGSNNVRALIATAHPPTPPVSPPRSQCAVPGLSALR